ncbi:hypothetical protein [Flagellimonas beolgyonensis]|uniref:hypothetical protein n=1 Tax=Flagellimonas beolgyonensis TaxID=864064 RepID=UPI000F8D9717|nr:hypothetical protein [Allomuricauda beolgyonensis]
MRKEPNSSPLQTVKDFLHHPSQDQLEITFSHLEIHNQQHGQWCKKVQRPQSRILLRKLPQNGLAEITVVDNLVFRFSFKFRIPISSEFNDLEMLCLPRPLDQGLLSMDDEKLQLTFRIDAPDPALHVQVTQVYQGILGLQRTFTPLYRSTRSINR